MADLISAARKQIEYAGNMYAKGNAAEGKKHLDKAEAFLVRAAVPVAVAVADEPPPDTEWSGTFADALDRFLDALEAKQKADGVEVLIRGSYSGHAYTREEHIALAKSVGVLDELGGDDFFGPLVPGSKQ